MFRIYNRLEITLKNHNYKQANHHQMVERRPIRKIFVYKFRKCSYVVTDNQIKSLKERIQQILIKLTGKYLEQEIKRLKRCMLRSVFCNTYIQ